MTKTEQYIEKLRSSNLRPTSQRIQICEFLFDRDQTFHFTVEDLDQKINKVSKNDKISLATLYNTVHAFTKAGHLKEITIHNDKTTYYDTNVESHHHFYDENNKDLCDIKYNDIDIGKIPNPPKGKRVKEVEVLIKVADKK